MDVDRALRLLKVPTVPPGVHLVKCTWLSLCISEKKLLDVGSYSLLSPMRSISLDYMNDFVMSLIFLPNVKRYFGGKLFCPFRESEASREDISCEEPTAQNTEETASDKHDQVIREEPVDVV